MRNDEKERNRMQSHEIPSETGTKRQVGFRELMRDRLALINQALDNCMPVHPDRPAAVVYEAIRYSLLSGGKRLRALLPMLVVESYGLESRRALASACALEMIHTYSLIHDDLPCMDDDDLRRGYPTNHKVYGEAMALLAGDALLTAAFGRLQRGCLDGDFSPDVLLDLLGILADAAGPAGMVGGQVLDMQGLGPKASLAELQMVHRLKTGALLRAAVLMGAVTAQAPTGDLEHWHAFGDAIGLAFQIQDDILDLVGDETKMGKKAGRDAKNNKVTYVTLLGIQGARQALQAEHQRMLNELAALPIERSNLEQLIAMLIVRER